MRRSSHDRIGLAAALARRRDDALSVDSGRAHHAERSGVDHFDFVTAALEVGQDRRVATPFDHDRYGGESAAA